VWVSWNKVCKSREAEGLGILDLKAFNTTLLGKWIGIWGWIRGVRGRRFWILNMVAEEVFEKVQIIVRFLSGRKN